MSRYAKWAGTIVAGLAACACVTSAAQSAPATQQIQQLFSAGRWAEVVRLAAPVHPRSSQLDFYYGMALAHLGRWTDAQHALEAGRALAPDDERFPVELAGIAFTQKKYPLAAHRLRQALKLAPHDAYANNFLATVYFLEGNLEAALKYWNRVGKPEIDRVLDEPVPRVSPVLLDRAFTFSRASTLSLPEFLSTNARIRGLGIFPEYQFDLEALPNGHFDAVFRNDERDGMGGGKLEALFLALRGLPFQEVNPGYSNFHREAVNLASMLRWDAQKRRIFADLSGPFEHGAKYRWNFAADLRDENWAIRNSFTGPAPVLASFNMRTETAGFNLTSHAGGVWNWSAGGQLSHRNFRSVNAGAVLTPQMLASGYELKQTARLGAVLWRVPEHRFTVDGAIASQAARLWAQPQRGFEKLTGQLAWHWFPRPSGDDYETTQSFRAGHTFGQPPFDELFILGLERDNDLPLPAHIGTRDGRKGSAPLGRDYFLENWETDKNIYSIGIVQVQLAPFFDVGKITDPGTALGSHRWLFDTGAEAKVRVLGSGLVFSYGKDLRTGNNAFYVTLLK
jgi:tetratricopeptide (TPR) repeat protein